jgi:hypothetical protein
VCCSVVTTLITSSVVFPSTNGSLDTFIVKVGIVLLLESRQDGFQLLDAVLGGVTLLTNADEMISQLFGSLPCKTDQHTHLALLSALSLDNLALLTTLDFSQLFLPLRDVDLRSRKLGLQSLDSVLDLLSQALRLGGVFVSLLVGIVQSTLTRLGLLSPFLANLVAFVLTLDTTDASPFFATITAEVVVAEAVVDAGVGDVVGLMALVLAVESRQDLGRVYLILVCGIGESRRREWGEVGAGRGARLIGAIRAVAIIVVDLGERNLDGWIRNASK